MTYLILLKTDKEDCSNRFAIMTQTIELYSMLSYMVVRVSTSGAGGRGSNPGGSWVFFTVLDFQTHYDIYISWNHSELENP